jgi:hypothetical protein
MCVHCGLDQCPAKVRGAGLGELAAPARLAGFLDDRIQAGQPCDLAGAAEAARLADLREQMEARIGPTP